MQRRKLPKPRLHLTKALTTELRFTAQWRCLGDQRVWTVERAVDFVGPQGGAVSAGIDADG